MNPFFLNCLHKNKMSHEKKFPQINHLLLLWFFPSPTGFEVFCKNWSRNLKMSCVHQNAPLTLDLAGRNPRWFWLTMLLITVPPHRRRTFWSRIGKHLWNSNFIWIHHFLPSMIFLWFVSKDRKMLRKKPTLSIMKVSWQTHFSKHQNMGQKLPLKPQYHLVTLINYLYPMGYCQVLESISNCAEDASVEKKRPWLKKK